MIFAILQLIAFGLLILSEPNAVAVPYSSKREIQTCAPIAVEGIPPYPEWGI